TSSIITEKMKISAKYLAEEDLMTRVVWINDPRINNSMFFEIPATLQKTKDWFIANVGNKRRVDFSFFDDNRILIAMGGFTGIDATNCHAEFYVMVNPDMQGLGVGKRISKWMFNYAFLKFDLHKIFLYTNDSNVKAYKIYEDASFRLEGILREHKWKNGEFQKDRKSTRLNSSHVKISYAVFCLKKKNKKK